MKCEIPRPGQSDTIGIQPSEEQLKRTADLFNLPGPKLAQRLIGLSLTSPASGNRLQILTTKAFTRDENLARKPYEEVLDSPPGELHVVKLPESPHSSLSLVTALTGPDSRGACVYISAAQIVSGDRKQRQRHDGDITTTVFKPEKVPSHISKFLHLGVGGKYKLQFLDGSDTLYLSRMNPQNEDTDETVSTPEEITRNPNAAAEEYFS